MFLTKKDNTISLTNTAASIKLKNNQMRKDTITIITFILIIIPVILKYYVPTFIRKRKKEKAKKALIEKPNDTLIVICGKPESVDKAIDEFIYEINSEELIVTMRLYATAENTFAITFPYDVDFGVFCSCVNFLHYPIGVKENLNVIGWTTPTGSKEVKNPYKDKKCMVFVPADDEEYDMVSLTTSENIGYNISVNKTNDIFLDTPKMSYKEPAYKIDEFANYPYKDLL